MRSLEKCMENDTALRCEAIVYGYTVGSSMLLFFGTVGNVWTAFIVTRGTRRSTPTSALMLALAVADTLALWVGPGRHLIRNAFAIDPQGLSSVGCKLQRFLLYSGMDASSGFIAALSADRFIAVCRPNLWKSFTLARARITIATLAAASAAFNVHVFWTRGPQEIFNVQRNRTEEIICGFPVPTYDSLVQGWVALVYYVVVPFFVMVVLNFCVVWKLRAQRMLFVKMSSSHNETRKRDEVMLTVMLLGVSLFFLCVTTPASVYNTIESMLSSATKNRIKVLHAYMTMLQYLNYAVNFYLYMLLSRRFRCDVQASLRALCCCCGSAFLGKPPAASSDISQECRTADSTCA